MGGCRQEHAPCKTFAPKFFMVVDCCGHQLAQMLGWVTPVYLKKEGAIPYPGVPKQNLQYDKRPFCR